MPTGIYIRTEKTKRILSFAHKGHSVSKETRRKLSKAHKGKTLSKEHKRKISKSLKGRINKPHSKETKRRMSFVQKGHSVSEEQRKKISKKLKGRKLSEEHKRKIGEASRKRKHSEETKQKLRKIKTGFRFTKEQLEKLSHSHKGQKAWNKGISPSIETREKMRKAAKQRWQNKEYKDKNLKLMFDNLDIRPTKPEIKMIEILKTLFPNEYRYVGDGSVLIGYKNPDFININNQKKIIEIYGNYWHSKERTGRTKRQEENQRTKHFAKYGFQTLIVWERELKDMRQLEKKILEFHNE